MELYGISFLVQFLLGEPDKGEKKIILMSLPNRGFVLTLLGFLILKITLAVYLPLVNDEAYAIAVSKEFSLSFFDHPPIGFWLASLFTELSGIQNPFLFRLPYIFCGLGTTYILFQLGKEVGGYSVGIWSALLYNTAPFFMLSGGLLVVPDGPLNLAISASSLCIIHLHKENCKKDNIFLLILGICLALSFASKYQGFLFGLGCLLVLCTSTKRSTFLQNPYFYVSLLIAVLGLLPTFIWNLQHQWVSFQFHGARQGTMIDPNNFTKMVLGSTIYLLPPVILIPVFQLISFFLKLKNRTQLASAEWHLILMATPNILVFTFVFIFSSDTFPHWIMPGWLLLLPMVAKILSIANNRLSRMFFASSFLVIWPILGILVLHTQTGILTNRMKEIPAWDNTLELVSWNGIRKPLISVIQNLDPFTKPKLAALTWTEAGQLSTLMKNEYETLVINGEPHHFSFLSKSQTTASTFLVKISLGLNPNTDAILSRIRRYDNKAIHIRNITLFRGKREYATASVYLLNL